MNDPIIQHTAQKLGFQQWQIQNTVKLLDEGGTIPFISRYRKERTGNLDEVQVQQVQEELAYFRQLEKRKTTILDTIEEQGQLTDELREKINSTFSSEALEDIYLPYKPKRKTRGVKAREQGLEPLAVILFRQRHINPELEAEKFLNDDIPDTATALQGARDIIAEWVNEHEAARKSVRQLMRNTGHLSAQVIQGKESEGEKYADYFDHSEALRKIPSHRFLAIKRGEKEGILRIKLTVDEEEVQHRLKRYFLHTDNDAAAHVRQAAADGYKRLMFPALERELMQEARQKADETAINVFAENLKQLLLAPPLGGKRILAIDPGFQSGSKVVCLDEGGEVQHNETIYPHPPQRDTRRAASKIRSLTDMYNIEAIAIGNGTASRETENFIRNKVNLDREVQVFMVNEDGASVYSASSVGREELPEYDVTVRGAASIGRRLMDPLAELVKIDPKSIGVGQYQHDVEEKHLQDKLRQVVENTVNKVGVELNTASRYLLTYVSGLNDRIAKNIVAYRRKNGAFTSRKQLKKVSRLGDKTYEQAAGFLRIKNAKNPLDNSAVHPESYYIVEKMASNLGADVADLIQKPELHKQIRPEAYTDDQTGLPTVKDILKELEKPGRDPREKVATFNFSQKLKTIQDIEEGMIVPGLVTNITNFGAFVDIGIKENGLIHISNLAHEYISDPTQVVKLHQQVNVKIISIDRDRKRIQLSLKDVDL